MTSAGELIMQVMNGVDDGKGGDEKDDNAEADEYMCQSTGERVLR